MSHPLNKATSRLHIALSMIFFSATYYLDLHIAILLLLLLLLLYLSSIQHKNLTLIGLLPFHLKSTLGEFTPSYILHTRAFGTYLFGGLFTLQKNL
jgi:hypothetical protein